LTSTSRKEMILRLFCNEGKHSTLQRYIVYCSDKNKNALMITINIMYVFHIIIDGNHFFTLKCDRNEFLKQKILSEIGSIVNRFQLPTDWENEIIILEKSQHSKCDRKLLIN
jgi:hypothetical protein